MKRIVLDCETQKMWNEINDQTKTWDLKLSTAVTYCYDNDEYKFWTYMQQNDLLDYLNGNLVIGYNSIKFDCPLILGEGCKLDENGNCTNGKYTWSNFDILIEIYKRLYSCKDKPISKTFEAMKKNFSPANRGVYKLNSIAIATLGHGKTTKSGDEAVELFKTKKIIELLQNNLNDCRVTKQVYDFIRKFGYVLNGNFDVIKLK